MCTAIKLSYNGLGNWVQITARHFGGLFIVITAIIFFLFDIKILNIFLDIVTFL